MINDTYWLIESGTRNTHNPNTNRGQFDSYWNRHEISELQLMETIDQRRQLLAATILLPFYEDSLFDRSQPTLRDDRTIFSESYHILLARADLGKLRRGTSGTQINCK